MKKADDKREKIYWKDIHLWWHLCLLHVEIFTNFVSIRFFFFVCLITLSLSIWLFVRCLSVFSSFIPNIASLSQRVFILTGDYSQTKPCKYMIITSLLYTASMYIIRLCSNTHSWFRFALHFGYNSVIIIRLLLLKIRLEQSLANFIFFYFLLLFSFVCKNIR